MSLLWDVYRNPNYQKISFLNTALYISFFPQLIAGPIVRYDDIIHQIKTRKETLKIFNSGIHRFILGLFKKVIIANQLAQLADNIFSQPQDLLTSSTAWLGIIAYTFQIYFDFSGYSDMAIGLGRMFGFSILENFNFPYTSKSIQEFWRRWHISLSTWFRDYLYIPIGGNRVSPQKTYINLIFVFLCTGFWHGATWSFIFWGGFHGMFLILERIGFNRILKRLPSFLSWFYTITIVMIGWVFFRIESFSEALSFVGLLFSFSYDPPLFAIKFLDRENIIIIILAFLSSSRIFEHIRDLYFTKQNELITFILKGLQNIVSILVLLYVIMILNAGSYNPFIYFRF
jgi:alginate O-acetyltransferase complex protein AlgI